MFDKLDKAGSLKDPYFRGYLNYYWQRLALCRKAEQAVRDLEFMLKQPAAEIPTWLSFRVRFILQEQKPAAAVESVAKLKQLAGDKPDQRYDAACLYAFVRGRTSPASSGSARQRAYR
jgi:hypothetical protein